MNSQDNEALRGTQKATADFVGAMAMELAQIARGHGLDTLSYILEMARLEAENLARGKNGRGS